MTSRGKCSGFRPGLSRERAGGVPGSIEQQTEAPFRKKDSEIAAGRDDSPTDPSPSPTYKNLNLKNLKYFGQKIH